MKTIIFIVIWSILIAVLALWLQGLIFNDAEHELISEEDLDKKLCDSIKREIENAPIGEKDLYKQIFYLHCGVCAPIDCSKVDCKIIEQEPIKL